MCDFQTSTGSCRASRLSSRRTRSSPRLVTLSRSARAWTPPPTPAESVAERFLSSVLWLVDRWSSRGLEAGFGKEAAKARLRIAHEDDVRPSHARTSPQSSLALSRAYVYICACVVIISLSLIGLLSCPPRAVGVLLPVVLSFVLYISDLVAE